MGAEITSMFFTEFFNEIPDLNNLARIKADRRLVQSGSAGFRSGLGQAHPLLIAFRQVLNQPPPHIADLHDIHNLFE